MESIASLVTQANGTPALPQRPVSSKRPATTEDLNKIWRLAVTSDPDGWAYGGECGLYEVPTRRLSETIQEEIDRFPQVHVAPADVERLLAAAEKEQARRDEHCRRKRHATLVDAIGQRFANATLDGYQVTSAEQRKVVDALKTYATDIKTRVAAGAGIVLFGNAGTGKTHLLSAVAKSVIQADLTVRWINGQDLFASFRDAISGDGSESAIVRELVAPDVLVIDDVLPPGGTLTEYQASSVYRIVDSRYRACRPTWATMNVAGGTEAEHGMGVQIVDRLRDGALTLFCDWVSYRKAQT